MHYVICRTGFPGARIRAVHRLNFAPPQIAWPMIDNRYDQFINPAARFSWKAAVLAGLIGAGIAWLLSHGLPWFTSGMVSPTLLGRDLKPAGLIDPLGSVVTTITLVVVSVLYALIIAPLVTRLRGMWAVAVGGVIGFGLYLLNYAVFRLLMNADLTGTEFPVLVTHVTFGAVVAGLYKGLANRGGAVQAASRT